MTNLLAINGRKQHSFSVITGSLVILVTTRGHLLNLQNKEFFGGMYETKDVKKI